MDHAEWDPQTDPLLETHFSASDLSGKAAAKQALLEQMGLPMNAERPVIGIISRFAHQKGFEILGELGAWLGEQDVAFAVLGSGETPLEEMFQNLAAEYPTKFAVRFGYDNRLAHLIEAGSDMFLMPSRYEPCGLNQIYSLRYGTIPIVRSTGGLADTVDEQTGFKFVEHTALALQEAITEALAAFEKPSAWNVLVRNAMAKDFSWTASATKYQSLYHQLR